MVGSAYFGAPMIGYPSKGIGNTQKRDTFYPATLWEKRVTDKPKARCMDQIEKDLKVKNWMTIAHNRLRWKEILEQARIHPGQ